MNGISTLYYENSQIKRIENYKMMNLLTENVLMKTELKLLFSYYIKPEFPGGIKEFYKYVGENFKSPNSAKGQIKVAFVVQIDGTFKTSIIEGLNSDMNVEALRVFNSPCGSWKSGW
jgi:hypothetical protein